MCEAPQAIGGKAHVKSVRSSVGGLLSSRLPVELCISVLETVPY